VNLGVAGGMDAKPKKLENLQVSFFKLGNQDKIAGQEAQLLEHLITYKDSKAEIWSSLWLDVKSTLPLKRVFKPEKGGEETTITETYKNLTLDEQIDAKTFEVPK
jgi:outer membrane lipoprotein-sorting protein